LKLFSSFQALDPIQMTRVLL